jgi:hypothetical protein
LVGLKGELAGRFLTRLAIDGEMLDRVMDPSFDLLEWLLATDELKLQIA